MVTDTMDTEIILLSSDDPDRDARIEEAIAGAMVTSTARLTPEALPSGPLWCFIELSSDVAAPLEMCRQIRRAAATAHAHITAVQVGDVLHARRQALQAGADNCIPGPLDADLVIEHLKLMKSDPAIPSPRPRLAAGDLVLNFVAHQIRYRDRPIHMSNAQLQIMAMFMSNPNRVFTRATLSAAWGQGHEVDEQTVSTWIIRIRRILKDHGVPDPFRSVRAIGYAFEPAVL